MVEMLNRMWARASNVERFLFAIIPPCLVWDFLNGNLLDFVVATVVLGWLMWDLNREDRS